MTSGVYLPVPMALSLITRIEDFLLRDLDTEIELHRRWIDAPQTGLSLQQKERETERIAFSLRCKRSLYRLGYVTWACAGASWLTCLLALSRNNMDPWVSAAANTAGFASLTLIFFHLTTPFVANYLIHHRIRHFRTQRNSQHQPDEG